MFLETLRVSSFCVFTVAGRTRNLINYSSNIRERNQVSLTRRLSILHFKVTLFRTCGAGRKKHRARQKVKRVCGCKLSAGWPFGKAACRTSCFELIDFIWHGSLIIEQSVISYAYGTFPRISQYLFSSRNLRMTDINVLIEFTCFSA